MSDMAGTATGIEPERIWNALWGSSTGTEKAMAAALAAGGDPHARNEAGESILEVAFGCGNAGAARQLLQAGAAPSTGVDTGYTLAHLAVKNANTRDCWSEACLGLAIEWGVDPLAAAALGETPLMMAAKNGKEGCVRILLDAGANPRLGDRSGKSAIFYSLEGWGELEILDALLNGGASLEEQLPSGARFLAEAARHEDRGCVEWALSRSADVGARDSAGQGVLHAWAQSSAFDPRIAKMLAASGASLNAVDHQGQTPLLVAAKGKHWRGAAVLMELGADPRIADERGERPSMACFAEGEAGLACALDAMSEALDLAEHAPLCVDSAGRAARL